jgi:hypothetical protein
MESVIYEGDFLRPKTAKRVLLEHLKRLYRFVKAHGIHNPGDLGALASTFEVLVYALETVESEDVDGIPWQLFHESFDHGPSEELRGELGYDAHLILRGRYEYLRLVNSPEELEILYRIPIAQQEALDQARIE